MLCQKNVPEHEVMEKAEDLYDSFSGEDVQLKGFDDSGQDILYDVEFSKCTTTD